MKSSNVLREEIAAVYDRAQAIMALADAEKREPTAEERAECDALLGSGKPGEPTYTAGKLAPLKADLERAERIEAHQRELAEKRGAVGVTQADAQGVVAQREVSRVSRVVIPASSNYRHGKLVAYKGEHAEQRAYLAGRFLLATLFGDANSQRWCGELGLNTNFRAALTETANELGGFLVPDEMETAIIDLREKYGIFRQESKVMPMSSDTKTIPRRTGGVTAYFGGDSGTMTESNKNWDQVKLVAKKLYALCRYSNELSEDAIINIGDDLTNEIAYAMAVKEDQCGFVGDGTSTYGGITGVVNALAAGSIVTAASGHTGFGTLTLADFEACVGALPTYAESNAKWYVSKVGWANSMMHLIDAAGGNTTAWLQQGPDKVREFLGYPVVITQAMNNTLGADASKPKVVFGDLQLGSTLGNRRGMSVKMSDDRYFDTDEVGIRGTERFDINVHERGTASVAGALILLKSAAS